MTPQERELIAELFDKLATLETAARDPEAERAIAEGLRRAPHAIYPLVQTVLVQDEALKVANHRLEELQGAGGGQAEQPRGFLDTMRSGLFGRRTASVPTVQAADTSAWRTAPAAAQPQPMAQPVAQPAASAFGGGSFLGTAAAAAAGMVGGGLLLGGIRSMLGGGYGYPHSAFGGTFDSLSSGQFIDHGGGGGPWGGGGGMGSTSLARDAGVGDIGGGGDDYGGGASSDGAGPFDSSGGDPGVSDSDFGGGGGGGFDSSDSGGGGGGDYA
jgi:hypothetical protein